MKTRRVGPFEASAIGLGCMNLSHAYGTPPPEEAAQALLREALDLGITFFDTAALYGFGANEELVGRTLAADREKFVLASKCGLHGVDGQRVVDGRPATLKWSCEQSLKRLRTDRIDLFYLHRWDRNVPIEDSVGALADPVREGKVRAIGLSEVSAATLRRAHAVHPIAALQTEYSLWTRNPEIAVLQACRELGTAFVAFSPVARGFLGGELRDVSTLEAKDLRRSMPRFEPANYAVNLKLLDGYVAIAAELQCTPAQLALAWVLSRGEHVLAIPGTSKIAHLRDNVAAADIGLSASTLARLEALINVRTVTGGRYDAAAQAGVDTEEF
ncbi:aldo/keto reductase [Piscinibacter aquaticus]|uniref:Aldo/keto reductase n=1 Tax=Piscinibacter aquaticus TaxID=392597 RepID=A0A5C6U668_9BURK|nr:aldo/keto reductase [Piscinibacter aquaticus]